MTSKTPRTRRTKKLAGSARSLAGQVEDAATRLVDKLPDTAEAVKGIKGTALDAYHTVESMPKSQRKTVATFSVVTGAALWVLGAPRLLTFLAFLPAIAVGGMRMARRAA